MKKKPPRDAAVVLRHDFAPTSEISPESLQAARDALAKSKGRVLRYAVRVFIPDNRFIENRPVGWSPQMGPPWDDAHRGVATRPEAVKWAKVQLEALRDWYMPRRGPKESYSTEDNARMAVLKGLRFRVVVVRHKPFAERHLGGYRVAVGTSRVVVSKAALEPLRSTRGVTFATKELAKAEAAYWRDQAALLEEDPKPKVVVLSFYKKGPKPPPVPQEVAVVNRTAACERRRKFNTPQSAYAAIQNAKRRKGANLIMHGCEICGKWHLAHASSKTVRA